MPESIFDSGTVGELLPELKWKKKHFSYLYLCKKCLRSFETGMEVTTCKFCSEPVEELFSSQINKILKEQRFYLKCNNCGKESIAYEKKIKCTCGSEFAVIRWNKLKQKEKIKMKVKYFFGAPKIEIKFKTQKLSQPFSLGKYKFSKLSLPRFKDEEERPTY